MNNIVTNWTNILKQAQNKGIPAEKQRGILREYLQSLILEQLYRKKESKNLSFIGGTSLRLLRGLDRFSEDLDFDNLGNTDNKIVTLFEGISEILNKQSIENEFSFRILSDGVGHGSMKFTNLLEEIGITTDPREKLRIEIDFTTPIEKPETEVVTYSAFGFVFNIISNSMGTLFVQKANAFMNRKDPKARDMYDIIWFLSRNEIPNINSKLCKYSNENEFYQALLLRYEELEVNIDQYKKSLAPFLFEQQNVNRLDLLGSVLKQKIS